VLHLCAQHSKKPEIVVIIDFDDSRIRRWMNDKALLGLVSFKLGIEGDDDLRAYLANGWNQHLP
jgi:hypothetical protein